MKLISIIVPIYNVGQYLNQCINSIQVQTYQNIEVILVDDGSTDDSGNICDAYAKRDNRIIVIHKTNGGLVSARKTGLRNATGEYVVYVDGDDWIEPDSLENMYNDIKQNAADIALYSHFENLENSQVIVHNSPEKGLFDKNDLLSQIYPQMITGDKFYEWKIFPAVWDVLIKRELLNKVQFDVDDDISIGEDAACIYPCFLLAERVLISNKAFYHYRQSTSSMIKQRNNQEEERRKFVTLYRTVNKKLEELAYIYDLREQWVKYMMFLMLPRAEHLYKEFYETPYFFPYKKISPGCRVAIYGAGTYGQRIYQELSASQKYIVVAWFDRNYVQLRKNGLDVLNPDTISEYEYDQIIIANMFFRSRTQIRKIILDKTRKDNICELEEDFIFSKEVMERFGLD